MELSEPCPELDALPVPLQGAPVALWIEQAITKHGECAIKADRLIEAYSPTT